MEVLTGAVVNRIVADPVDQATVVAAAAAAVAVSIVADLTR